LKIFEKAVKTRQLLDYGYQQQAKQNKKTSVETESNNVFLWRSGAVPE